MKPELVKEFLDSCHEARKITELMPTLPKGIKPRHLYILHAIFLLESRKSFVKVSDVSQRLRVTKPSITKMINELEDLKVLVKKQESSDKRIISLKLTALGEQYLEQYVIRYHFWLSGMLEDIEEKEMEITIRTISKVYEIMKNSKNDFENGSE